MVKKHFVKIAFLSLLIFGLVGCSSKSGTESKEKEGASVKGGEIKIAYAAQPPKLDPQVTSAVATTDIMGHVFESLVTFDSEYNTQPMLAESYETSEDGKTITFLLRKGVKFHNGKEMTAEDVVASMERWVKVSADGYKFKDVTFAAKDDYTVIVSLREPLSIALTTMAHSVGKMAAILPKEIIESADNTGVSEFIGTGPYKFIEWKPDQYIHLTKFEDYQSRSEPANGLAGKKEALVDDLKFIFTPDSSTRIAGIQSGEFDIAHSIPYDNIEQLETDPNLKSYTWTGANLHLIFNKKEGLFTDVKARQAIAAALDMDKILISAFANEKYYTLNHNTMMADQEGKWNSKIGLDLYNQKDPKKAKKLLKDLNYNGEEITLLTDKSYEEHFNASVVVLEQLKDIGMNVKLEAFDWPTTLERSLSESGYDMWVVANGVQPEPTSVSYLSKNYAGWTDSPDLDNILEKFISKPSIEDAQEVYDDILDWHWEYLPAVKIGEYSRIMVMQKGIDNLRYQNQLMLWNVSKNE